MKYSIVIPAYNEAETIEPTLRSISDALRAAEIDHEILVVDDSSKDETHALVTAFGEHTPEVRCVRSHYRNGFGFAVRAGLETFTGDAVAIVMADGSDHPDDIVAYYRVLDAGFDCAFGSRFMPGSRVYDYPRFKLVVNRLVNWGVRMLFGHGYDDTTNAFKAYRREVIDSVQPLLSQHFNLTVEVPLKAVVRGHSYAITPIRWTNRAAGESKLHLNEMGGRNLFIVLMVFLEHHLSRGDYRRANGPRTGRWRAAQPAARFYDDVEDRTRAADGG